jgi:YD repeat-containing protein
LATTQTFGYAAAGNVTSRVNRASQTTGFAYDARNRLTTQTPPSSGP